MVFRKQVKMELFRLAFIEIMAAIFYFSILLKLIEFFPLVTFIAIVLCLILCKLLIMIYFPFVLLYKL